MFSQVEVVGRQSRRARKGREATRGETVFDLEILTNVLLARLLCLS